MYSSLLVSVTVTIIRQTFQYMDMTCSVLTVCDPILCGYATFYYQNLIWLNIYSLSVYNAYIDCLTCRSFYL